ncbi:hypothetical protein PA25_33740 [Pseudoalteromonas sp. A25]|uniref:cytochrome b562 n=1 Tax=Pseudoalteromonas sp. A25 TaxID=116092 RepID=UPI0012605219|nr:cytochrome b562 [Pseudoalteromonas sp. A25]BBN83389.1 hypothetical protein PA25_33740 [Pseudoalteromonas sp. A25]
MYQYLYVALLCLSSFAFSKQSSDLEVTMKNMGHAYKQAMQSESQQELLAAIDSFREHLHVSKQHQFSPELHDESQKGLSKVSSVLDESIMLVNQGHLVAAKTKLKEIDELRKHYHQLHEPPSIWDLLFGN